MDRCVASTKLVSRIPNDVTAGIRELAHLDERETKRGLIYES